MCELGTKDSNWVAVSPWETQQPQWSRTRLVLDHINRVINDSKIYGNEHVSVKLMMGTDVLQSFLVPNLWSEDDVSLYIYVYVYINLCLYICICLYIYANISIC